MLPLLQFNEGGCAQDIIPIDSYVYMYLWHFYEEITERRKKGKPITAYLHARTGKEETEKKEHAATFPPEEREIKGKVQI